MDLKKRKYLSSTSMTAELSFLVLKYKLLVNLCGTP